VLTSKRAGFSAGDPLLRGEIKVTRNYIGIEGVLKSSLFRLTLDYQQVRVLKKRG
jgi:hypothetical protein